jgi:hypothetical protein
MEENSGNIPFRRDESPLISVFALVTGSVLEDGGVCAYPSLSETCLEDGMIRVLAANSQIVIELNVQIPSHGTDDSGSLC